MGRKLVWEDCPNQSYTDDRPYKHAWSFYYWLKKNGDNPKVAIRENGNLDITIETKELF